MFNRIKKWWAGEFRETPLENVLNGQPYENVIRPWPVRVYKTVADFLKREWKWVIGTIVALIVAVAKFGGR